MEKTIIDQSLIEVASLLQPLRELNSPEDITQFIKELGWYSGSSAQINLDLSTLTNLVVDLAGKVQAVTSANNDNEFYTALLELAEHVTLIINRIITDAPQISNAIENLPDLIGPVGQVEEALARNIIDYLVVQYLRSYHPKIYSIFSILGLANTTVINEEISIRRMRWGRIPWIFSDPIRLLNTEYSWESNFNSQRFLTKLDEAMEIFPLPGGVYQQDQSISLYLNNNETYSEEIRVPLLQKSYADSVYTELGINLSAWHNNNNIKGLAIYPTVIGGFSLNEDISENWEATLKGTLELDSGLALLITPPHDIDIETSLFTNPAQSIEAVIEAGINRKLNPEGINLLFGKQDGTHLGYESVGAKLIASTSSNGQEISFELNIDHIELAISTDGGDGFIQKLLSGISVDVFFDLVFGISNLDGVYFRGSGGLEIEIPIHEKLGPIDIESLFITFNISKDINITLATSLGAKLGPIQASVSKIGLIIPIKIEDDLSGNLGPLDISKPEFKPPIGAGLSLDTGFLVGGGYLEIDNVNKRYAGILELKFGEIGLVAIGLITTRMPDGSDGFSLYINISVTFSPPIQLSFGFVLAGVGGLLGYNRTMLTDVLRAGLKNKTLDSILFPEDPILNAQKIISDSRAVFPAAQGRFVIGPMIKMGWGSPPLITVDVGVFIELPAPVRIVLLGQIAATFPSSELIIVEIHIDVLGIVDFGKKELSIDASIYDSRIYQLVLKGDAALRLSWGDNPVFIVSLGGFHPRFTPPPSLTTMSRLSLSISQSSSLQIFCWTYQALTSNSLQFGAGVEFYASAAGATVEGGMSFDALIYFNPFSFTIDMSGHLVARYQGFTLAGVYLSLSLSGPSPWNARGEATFEILFWDISVGFDVTWGPSENERLPAIDPWIGSVDDDIMGLRDALELKTSWGSRLPAYANMFEALKEMEEEEAAAQQEEELQPGEEPPPEKILVHPTGRLEMREKILPWAIHLGKLGNNPVRDHNDFIVESVTVQVGESSLDLEIEPLLEDFSRGQYQNLNKIQRLTLPSFEKMQAGILAGANTVYFSPNTTKYKRLFYESILINPDLTSAIPNQGNEDKAKATWHNVKYQLRHNAVKQSGIVSAGRGKFATPGKSSKLEVQQEGYYVVKADDLSLVRFDQLSSYKPSWPENDGQLTRTKADELMSIYQKENPEEEVQVISAFEYEEAA
jgi:hypothetical protein